MSRKKAGNAKKAAPIKLAWQDQIIAAEWPEKPARASIYAVAMMLASFADRDGGGACPAVATIASKLRVKRQTVCDVLGIMVEGGHLAKTGRTAYGTVIYSLCLTRHTESTAGVPHAVSPRGTQLPTLDRKGEGGGDRSPADDAPTAVVAGINTDDDRANQIIGEFITAFDATFAKRERSSTVATQRLEPHHDKLRRQIITKIDAGWPLDHLIDRIIADLPDDYKINSLTGLTASKLQRIPDQPDAAARTVIKTREVAAAAQIKLDEADRKQRETIQKRRRDDALDRYRKTLIEYRWVDDVDAEVAAFIEINDTEDGTFDSLAQREAWQLCDEWIGAVEYEIKWVIENASTARKTIDALIKDTRKALDYEGCPSKHWDERIASALAAANLDLDKITMHANHDLACKTLRGYINRLTGCDDRGMTVDELIAEREAYFASLDDDRVMQALTGTAELIQTSDGSDTW